MNCVAVSWIRLVANTAHTKIGIRNRLMPGGRMRKMVTIRLSDPRIDGPIKKTAQKVNW